jgi:hypothetical protein
VTHRLDFLDVYVKWADKPAGEECMLEVTNLQLGTDRDGLVSSAYFYVSPNAAYREVIEPAAANRERSIQVGLEMANGWRTLLTGRDVQLLCPSIVGREVVWCFMFQVERHQRCPSKRRNRARTAS